MSKLLTQLDLIFFKGFDSISAKKPVCQTGFYPKKHWVIRFFFDKSLFREHFFCTYSVKSSDWVRSLLICKEFLKKYHLLMGEIKQNLLVKNMLTQQVCCKKAVCQTGFYQKPVGQAGFCPMYFFLFSC